MKIRIRDTGAVVLESEFRALFPNSSLPALTVEMLDELGADPVLQGPQAQPNRFQYAFDDGVEQIDGQWFTKQSVADCTPEAIEAMTAQQAATIRSDRDRRCDEFQPRIDRALRLQRQGQPSEDIAVLDGYMQALADVPTQAGFPWDIEWPAKPE